LPEIPEDLKKGRFFYQELKKIRGRIRNYFTKKCWKRDAEPPALMVYESYSLAQKPNVFRQGINTQISTPNKSFSCASCKGSPPGVNTPPG
jgi:hypothetical protein